MAAATCCLLDVTVISLLLRKNEVLTFTHSHPPPPLLKSLFSFSHVPEEKAMYSTELEKHKKEKDEWRRKAGSLEDQASALQVWSIMGRDSQNRMIYPSNVFN